MKKLIHKYNQTSNNLKMIREVKIFKESDLKDILNCLENVSDFNSITQDYSLQYIFKNLSKLEMN